MRLLTTYNLMKNILKNTIIVSLSYIALDFFGFMMWATSGQYPPQGYFLGILTKTIINFILKLL